MPDKGGRNRVWLSHSPNKMLYNLYGMAFATKHPHTCLFYLFSACYMKSFFPEQFRSGLMGKPRVVQRLGW